MKFSSVDPESIEEKARWEGETLPQCYNDDALFGYMVRMVGQMNYDRRQQMNDEVLHRLLQMGIFDWKGEDKPMHQATRAIRFSTAIAGRIIPRLLDVEAKVGGSLIYNT